MINVLAFRRRFLPANHSPQQLTSNHDLTFTRFATFYLQTRFVSYDATETTRHGPAVAFSTVINASLRIVIRTACKMASSSEAAPLFPSRLSDHYPVPSADIPSSAWRICLDPNGQGWLCTCVARLGITQGRRSVGVVRTVSLDIEATAVPL